MSGKPRHFHFAPTCESCEHYLDISTDDEYKQECNLHDFSFWSDCDKPETSVCASWKDKEDRE